MHEHIPAEEELVDDGNPREPICESAATNGMGRLLRIDCEDGLLRRLRRRSTWYDPGEWVKCSTCEGKGGWWICVKVFSGD